MLRQVTGDDENSRRENPPDFRETSKSGLFQNLYLLIRKVARVLRVLNIFPSVPPTTDLYKLQTQRIATRLFIVSFLVAFIILLIYSFTNINSRIITIKTPNLIQYDQLFSLHASTLSCPCSQITIEYNTIMEIEYLLHPVCSSVFVTDDWINYLLSTAGYFILDDFRAIGLFLFQALKSFCQLSDDTIKDSLNQFYSQSYISTTLTARKTLKTETNASINQFISTTTNSFTSLLHMMMNTTHVNGLASALFTDYVFHLDLSSLRVFSYPNVYDDGCTCIDNSQCKSKLFIYENNNRSSSWHVPGFYEGCFIVEALRKSHIGCLYNKTCLQELDQHIQSQLPLNATPLDASHLIHFTADTLLGSIIDELMVDRWQGLEIFAQYYNACKPSECHYTIVGRDSLIGVVTTVIGLIGGLVTILKLTIPHIIKFIRLLIKPRTIPVIDTRQRMHTFPKSIVKFFLTLNWFPSKVLPCDVYDEHTGRISTRSFIITMLVTFGSLVIYTSAMTMNIISIIPFPTIQQFDDLTLQYPISLSCPCSQMSSNYKVFIEMTYSLHPICDSEYLTDQWLQYISNSNEATRSSDFRLMAGLFFQSIRSFCELAEDQIKSNIAELFSNTYISTSATSKQLFDSQINATIRHFISSTTNTFIWSLELIRSTTQYNALLSGLFTNFFVYKSPRSDGSYSAPFLYGRCNCAYNRSCTSQLGMYHNQSILNFWPVPGFYRGCYVLEALLQCRLECLYNRTCLQELDFHLQSTAPMNVTPLHSSISSRFTPNTTMETIINALMVDEWTWDIQHENYFNNCRPLECTYTTTIRSSIILIVTTLIASIGGLVAGLKLIVPHVVRLIRWKLKPNNRILLGQSFHMFLDQPLKERLLRLIKDIVQYLLKLNLFPSYPPSTDRQTLRTQRISTRVFIIVFILIIVINLVYTSAVMKLRVFTHPTPDYNEYNRLFSRHWATLQCPCSQIATTYGTFIDLAYLVHPVCESMYVTDEWIRFIGGNQSILWISDFRLTGTFQFQALQYLCKLVVDLITDKVEQFYSKVYISTELAPKELLVSQAKATIQQFISVTENSFKLSLRTTRDVTQANAIISSLMQNYAFEFSNSIVITSFGIEYMGGCKCSQRSDCVEMSGIFSWTPTTIWYVPGFYFGCYILESLRQSHLDCFYNQTCLTELNSHLVSLLSMNLVALNSSSLNHFLPNSTVGQIIDELMVDEWKWSISHEKYYNSCQSVECSYQLVERNGVINIVTTLLGLIGGLITVLKLIVPRAVSFILKRVGHQRRRIGLNTINLIQANTISLTR